MSDHVQRCRAMLTEQIETLGTFRNASPRDAGFKLWRQNTLTVLQRIWPGDTTRSERFRRITFSPSHGKPDGQALRDWYTRGCSEATAFLEALVAAIDREGVPTARETPASAPPQLPNREDDFPVVNLPGSGGDTVVLSQGDSLADAAAMPGTDGHDSAAPAPPRLRVDVKGSVATTPSQSPVVQRPAQLKVQHAEAIRPETGPTPGGPTQLPNEPRIAPGAAPLAIEKTPPKSPGVDAPSTDSSPAAPNARKATRAAKPRKGATPKSKLKDMLGLNALEAAAGSAARELRAATPKPAPAPPAPPAAAPPSAPPAAPPPVAEDETLPEVDDATVARATEDFLRSSPVLGLTGKPVQRNTDDTGYGDPDAIGVATLANDVGRLGVADDAREGVRVVLLELAGQFEAHAPQWATLQRAITTAMPFPELAKRLMPIVLPWLNRAA